MDRLGLNHDDLRTYQQALTWTHQRRIHVHILDLQFNHLRSLTPYVLDGQVTIDTHQDVTRMLNLTFLDPQRALAFEPNSAGPALWRNRLVRVIYSVRVPDLNDWIDCAVFTGPVWDFQRQGAMVNITAHGMERLALGQAWHGRTYKAKSLRTDALKAIMGAVGDDCHAIPDLSHRLPHNFTVHKMDTPWKKARHLAESMNRYLFYDGHGHLHLRHFNDRPVFTFDTELLSPPSFERSKDQVINTVEVLGRRPKGAKHRVRGVSTAKGYLNPDNLGRGPQGLRLVQQIQNDHIRTKKEAQNVADRRLKHHQQQRVSLSFDSLPIPHLQEHDRVQVGSTGVGLVRLRMSQWSIPLGGGQGDGAPMTVGAVRRTTAAQHRMGGGHGVG